MGRKATSLKSKGFNPVTLPHDGPANFALKEPSFADEDIQGALQLVRGVAVEDNALSQMIAGLCRALVQAKTDKDQLKALQAFRSTLINAQENQHDFLQSAPTPTRALFRLLLEWSMSHQTTIPLRRAIQSCLNTLETDKEEIAQSVLSSFWGPQDVWQEPLVSLDVAVSSSFLLPILQQHLMTEVLLFMHRKWVTTALSGSVDQVGMVVAGLSVVNALKLLLRSPDVVQIPHLEDFQNYVIKLMECPTVPTEGFATLGIVYGALHFGLQQSSNNVGATASAVVQSLDSSFFSEVARVFIVQGITATLKTAQLVETVEGGCPLEVCSRFTLRYASHSTDPMVRWAAIKGLSTLASHWKHIPTSLGSKLQEDLVEESLQVLLQAWENPPLKKLGTAIPGVFQTLVGFLDEEQRHELCRTVLRQPPTRKGRYLALEILLPHFKLEDLPSSKSLLEGVGDRGPNTGPIADLWIKVLEHRWVSAEQLSQESTSALGLEEWLSHWVPALGDAVVSGSLSRRKRVTFFCVVRIFDLFRRTKSLQPHLSGALVRLVQIIGDNAHQSQVQNGITHQIDERALWALLVLTRYFHDNKGLSPEVKQALSRQIPPAQFQLTLIHASASLRLAGFQATESVVSQVYGQGIEQEAIMWKYALPFSTKVADNKEYTTTILQYLISFLDRLSAWENSTTLQEITKLTKLYDFVVEFLLNDVFVQQCAYPGAIADKEYFGLTMLDSLISFAVQDPHSLGGNPVACGGAIFSRSRSKAEEQTMKSILEAILSQEVIASLFGLLHSIWDNTRATSFRVLAGIVSVAQRHSIPIPTAYCGDTERNLLTYRALYLASSPRQREADTGSRIIAFLYVSQNDIQDRRCILEDLVNQFEMRLGEMKKCLTFFLKSQGSEDANSSQDTDLALPLVHGIIHGIRLTIESEANQNELTNVYDRFVTVCCNAIQLSLNIVADVRDGELIEGMDGDFLGDKTGKVREGQETPLNVNTGAIGANGTLSKLTSPEDSTRLAIQRIVIGTWLLTKEACAAASATVSVQAVQTSSVLVDRCGTLLVSTLIALKHTGAAFAAREALQQIATVCFNSPRGELRDLPLQWANRLLEELSQPDKVRDSTLRRSMGYGLGFMALMRSEVTTKSSMMCRRILRKLVTRSLPPASQMERYLQRLGLNTEDRSWLLLFSCSQEEDTTATFFSSDEQYESRCRVHALNVLRQLVLDAPLSRVVGDFIGDAIISSLLGYNDASWAVRNSSTMVFSAAMLRVVDPDKNATNTDTTSSQAITITELFRRYPALPVFLPALMDHCLAVGKEETSSQLFPILLLLSRIQPVSESGSSANIFANRFAPMVFDTLDCRDMIVREVASRALANVCSEIDGSPSSRQCTLQKCLAVIRSALDNEPVQWNRIDGILLAILSLTASSAICREESLDMGIQHTLLQVIEGNKREFPPTCRAAAIQVLMSLDLTAEFEERQGRACQLLCSSALGRPGSPSLSSQAAISMLRSLESDIWQSQSIECLDKALLGIHNIFCSNTIDVRIASVKAFKKTIYSNIDRILERETSDVPAELVLLKLTNMLLSCAQTEVDRHVNRDSAGGPHIPTLRRLSRCALECAFPIKTSIGTEDAASFWRVARSMIEIEQFLQESDGDFNGETFLSGNAAEFMSLALTTSSSWQEIADSDVTLFVNVVKRLNDPTASWRTRHSAAIAIETSGILLNGIKSHPLILMELVSMLQDSDSDVRQCASRAANQLGAQATQCLQASATLSSIFPLVFGVPEDATESVKHDVVQSLVTLLFTNCRNVVEHAIVLEEEFDHTRHLVTPTVLVRCNETNSRRIFEAEDPNPTQEKLLTNQLSVRALFAIPPYQSCQDHKDSMVLGIVNALEGMLGILQKNVGTGGLIHDFSRHPNLFVGLHGLICCVSAFIYLGTIEEEIFGRLQSLATSILAADSTSLHPEIVKALTSFSTASRGNTNTKESILNCLFLVEG